MRLRDLGLAVRRLRENSDPGAVGCTARGLPREELAELAGVSADYVRRLEQGPRPARGRSARADQRCGRRRRRLRGQLARHAGAHVIAAAGPRSAERVTGAGTEEVIDHTTTEVTAAVTEPVDVVLNLAPVEPAQLTALLALIRLGGALVNTDGVDARARR